MDDLELVFKVTKEELLALAGGGRRLDLPLSFWRALGQSLRQAGYAEFATLIDQAVSAAQARERLLAEKLQCMDPAYDPEVQKRCQLILEPDLRAGERP